MEILISPPVLIITRTRRYSSCSSSSRESLGFENGSRVRTATPFGLFDQGIVVTTAPLSPKGRPEQPSVFASTQKSMQTPKDPHAYARLLTHAYESFQTVVECSLELQ